MINRIRAIRKDRGLTLADLAERCDPPTTAQTIGRLETGMRNLSLAWMERIGGALGVDPESLVRSEHAGHPQVVASLRSMVIRKAMKSVEWHAELLSEGRMQGFLCLFLRVQAADP